MTTKAIIILTKLVGVSFKNKDGQTRQELIRDLGSDQRLTIMHEPNNPYDEHSHIVSWKGKILGHLNKDLAYTFNTEYKDKRKIITEYNVVGDEKIKYGLKLKIELK